MKPTTPPTSPDPSLSRREALRRTLLGGLALGASAVPPVGAAPTSPPEVEPPFVPENDYPFFGCEPDASHD